jgi:membrane fusion protein, protease secretion system
MNMKSATTNPQAVTDVSARPELLTEVKTNSKLHTRLGWWIIIVGIGGFVVWAMYAPLDKGVPLTGTVAVASSKKAIQHLTGGTVEAILVKEGAVVKAGDVLVRMNSVQANVNAETARIQYSTARATETRLAAERDGKSALVFSTELNNAKKDPRVANTLVLQQQLFSSRRAALSSELAAFDENITGLTLQNKGLEESREGKKQQLQFLKEQLDGMRDLAKEGFVPRNRLLELERTYTQLITAITEDTNNIGRSMSQISEIKLRKIQRTQDYQKEVRTQLSDVQREADGLANRLTGLDFDVDNALVKAPVDGTIVGMNIFTIGGIIGPGFRMMDVVPSDDPLIVEGQLPVHLIDKVHPNLKVELIFSAFNQNQTPHVPGIVTNVSADRLVDEKSGQPYYSVKAKVAPEGIKMIANLQIRPGMPVELFVKTGERTMMNYLLKPILDHLKMSMTEE